jgi:hypothetical protein
VVSFSQLYLQTISANICRAISRDPEVYPDPETFNPLRWLKPEYPTYKEPLTQFPTIINSSQFGYGRRVCQGQTVADEDLFIGIGSIAWLFNISKRSQDAPADLNKKCTISDEELNTGLPAPGPAAGEKTLTKYADIKPICPFPPGYKPVEWGHPSQKPEDPTLDYSILLIAKPIPFQFDLTPRDSARSNKVRELFAAGLEKGEYTRSREYWGPNQGRDKPVGWSKV